MGLGDFHSFNQVSRYKVSVSDILVSGQDSPSQPSGRAVIIIHYQLMMNTP